MGCSYLRPLPSPPVRAESTVAARSAQASPWVEHRPRTHHWPAGLDALLPTPPPDAVELDLHLATRVLELVRRMPHLVGLTDGTGEVLWLNAAGRRFVGAEPGQHLTTADLFTEAVFDRYYASIRPALVRDGVWTGELPVRRADGSEGVVDVVLTGDVGADGEVRWIGALAVDVTSQHEREAELSHQASHDPLTGLANR
ncbi:MAG TPA: hypothetical protein DCS55_24205, partial [Acidimicrobiaceae bacterium]|nr:hypothetical protein [Acidimicrobiaceae bacterium]